MMPTDAHASHVERARGVGDISGEWHDEDVSLYLERCQIDTPTRIVTTTWNKVAERRARVGKVVDFGAGDLRFARGGEFESYVGFEIDRARCGTPDPLRRVDVLHQCAFAEAVDDADLCIGNPPFVRNQDLPSGWRAKVAERLYRRSGVELSGLANAWQYFLMLALVSTRPDGLCALVIPYEWVSRPSCAALRRHVVEQGWEVDAYRLDDTTFDSVLTTSSITVVDKAARTGRWRFFHEVRGGSFEPLPSASQSERGHLPYVRPTRHHARPRVCRGLSPGSQRAFTLTEPERARCGLEVGVDVVACVTTLRNLPHDETSLCPTTFGTYFVEAGRRCWLLRTDVEPSRKLAAYLDTVEEETRTNYTCSSRTPWWRYAMPGAPDVLVATCFKGRRPKLVANVVGARAVGGVAGIHGMGDDMRRRLEEAFETSAVSDRIVAHAKGLRKIEIHQLNGLLAEIASGRGDG